MRALFILSLLLAGTAFSQWLPEPKDGSTIYVVKPDDTLSGISGHFFDNPMLWPRLWELNPYIDDPNLIYPGEILSLRAPALPVVKVNPEERRMGVKVPTPPPPVFYYSPGGSEGFISPDEWEHMGTILTSEPPKILLTIGDTVFINVGMDDRVREGDAFTIFRTGKELFHPLTGRKVGHKVAVLGELVVDQVIGKNLSVTTITKSIREITRGAKVRPQVEFVKEVVMKKGTRPADGIVLETLNGNRLSGRNDVVYIDVGSDENVVPGSMFSIFKYPRLSFDPDRNQMVRIPGARVGHLVALNVGIETSTCVIIESSRQIEIGDIVSLDLDYPKKL